MRLPIKCQLKLKLELRNAMRFMVHMKAV